ncbi:MAG TPA: pilus assembly protein N-terminal domain-containing protein [Alphaproteobacteria bacterium]|nr:pilus assembly protein N-terminal domain-containing protein [Alphaproteobacteria bacterium]
MRRLPLALLLAAALPAAIVLPAAAETLSVPVDTARLLRLGRPAQTVYVANPAIADVTVEAADQVFILGKRPGRTNLIVLDTAGKQVLSTAIVVVPPQEGTVTVTRGVAETHLSCAPRCAPLPAEGGGAPAAAPSP